MSSDRHYSAERSEVAKLYPGKGWIKKVMLMSDAQVHEVLVNYKKRMEKKAIKEKEECAG